MSTCGCNQCGKGVLVLDAEKCLGRPANGTCTVCMCGRKLLCPTSDRGEKVGETYDKLGHRSVEKRLSWRASS